MSYNTEGTVWASNTITYSFATTNLTGDKATFDGSAFTAEEQAITKAAFAAWAAVANVTFVEVADSAAADIRIGYGNGLVAGGELGQTTYAPEAYFDPDVRISMSDPGTSALHDVDGVLTYVSAGADPATFSQVITHEIGHALGLDHDYTDPSAIMAPSAGPQNTVLDADDIAGIQSLYGAAAGYVPPTTTVDPGYTTGPGYYVLEADASKTATIAADNTTIFGGATSLDYTGSGSTLVFNGAGQSGAVTIDSTGAGTVIWAGTGAVSLEAGGSSRVILGATPDQTTTLAVSGGSSTDTTEVDVWGQSGTMDTITHQGQSSMTLFGGDGSDANSVFTGDNAILVYNGTGTGAAEIHSTGGDTVWAGSNSITFYEGAGSDAIVSGNGPLFIYGAGGTTDGLTSVLNIGGTGAVQFDGGAKAALIDAGASSTFNFSAGSGNTTLNGGTGHLVADLAGLGATSLHIDGSGGNADIYGFSAVRDTLAFSAGSVASTTQTSSGMSIALTDGNTVLLHGYTGTDGLNFT